MEFSYRKSCFTTLLVFSVLVASFQLGAMRPLDGEPWLAKDEQLLLQALPRGGPSGSGHNPCTNVPGRETGVCKLGTMNIAGDVMHSPPAFPSVVADFGVASVSKGTH